MYSGIPQLAFAIKAGGSANSLQLFFMFIIAATTSAAPTPQLVPQPVRSGSISEARLTMSAAVTPIMVRPLVSILMQKTIGSPVVLAPRNAACASSSEESVSIQMISAPPSASACACSANASVAASMVSVPAGSKISPVGPMSPATITLRPLLSTASRSSSAARLLSSTTRFSPLCNCNRYRLPPKVLVSTRSEPASMKLW